MPAFKPRKLLPLAALLLLAAPLRAQDASTGRVEIKRENTDHGTDDARTGTPVQVEYYPKSATVLSWVVTVNVPDDTKSKLWIDPSLGDLEAGVRLKPIMAGSQPLFARLDFIVPTASPARLGNGKWEAEPGLFAIWSLPAYLNRGTEAVFRAQVRQIFSFAGDSDRKNINRTAFEFAYRELWGAWYAKTYLKPNVDWIQHGKTGADLELEAGRDIGKGWAAWVNVGHSLWGLGTSGIYGLQGTLGVGRNF